MDIDEDAEGEQRMQFSTDPDFEGGQWVDGEFLYRSKRQKQTQTKEDMIYGVFQDNSDVDEDDEDDLTGGAAGRRRRKRRKDKDLISKGDLTRPVNFVSKGSVNPNLDNDNIRQASDVAERREEAEEEDGERPAGAGLGFGGLGFGGLGLGATTTGSGGGKGGGFVSGGVSRPADEAEEENLLPTAFGQQIKERAERRREAERERRRQEREEQARREGRAVKTAAGNEIGTFEKHTKGIGLKLLQKMGYKGGGLGKNQQGIEKPVEAKMRPKAMGMGFNDFKEKEVSLPAPPGKEREGEEGGKPPVSVSEGRVNEKLWKKKHAGRKVEYKTAAQLLEEKQAGGKEVTQTILDMRGEQVRERRRGRGRFGDRFLQAWRKALHYLIAFLASMRVALLWS